MGRILANLVTPRMVRAGKVSDNSKAESDKTNLLNIFNRVYGNDYTLGRYLGNFTYLIIAKEGADLEDKDEELETALESYQRNDSEFNLEIKANPDDKNTKRLVLSSTEILNEIEDNAKVRK